MEVYIHITIQQEGHSIIIETYDARFLDINVKYEKGSYIFQNSFRTTYAKNFEDPWSKEQKLPQQFKVFIRKM